MCIEKFKYYLREVYRHEERNDSLARLIDYLTAEDTVLPKLYCEGKIYLPSFMLIKKLNSELTTFIVKDNELKHILASTLKCSKAFYSRLINIIIESHEQNLNFNVEFEKQVQPLGQRLINLLKSIRYRIRIISAEEDKQLATDTNPTLGNITPDRITYLRNNSYKHLYKPIWQLVYKASLSQASDHDFLKKTYYFFALLAIAIIWVINFDRLVSDEGLPAIFFNIIGSLAVIITSIIAYPAGDFGGKDISGQNLIAYRYKMFFNNFTKSRLKANWAKNL